MLYVLFYHKNNDLRNVPAHLLKRIIREENLAKLLKKRENQSSEVPRTTGKKQICKLFYSARIFLHPNI